MSIEIGKCYKITFPYGDLFGRVAKVLKQCDKDADCWVVDIHDTPVNKCWLQKLTKLEEALK